MQDAVEHRSNRQIKVGAALSYVHILVGAVITLLYTPFMIRILGKSEYGVYNTVSSTISSLSILSLGFGSGYVRFFSQYKMNGDERAIARLNGMFMTIFMVIGLVALGCGLYLTNHLDMVFDKGLTDSELGTARTLMLLLTFNLAVSFPCSVFSSIITANERFIFQKCIVLLKQVGGPLICIPLLLMGYASVGMVVSTVILYVLAEIINGVFVCKSLHAKFVFGRFDGVVFKSLAVYSGFIAINMVVDQINLNIDKILLARFCGSASVAVYSAGYTLYHYYSTFSTSISNMFTPRIHHIWNDAQLNTSEKDARLSALFARVGRIQFVILLLVCSGLAIFGRQFIRIWAGDGYDNAYYVVMLLAVSAITPLTQNVGIEIQRAKNRHKFRSIIYAGMAVINLILSIFLCQRYGEVGSAIGTAISFVVANSVIMDIYYHRALNIDVSIYWRQCARMLCAALPAFAAGYALVNVFDTTHIVPMLLSIILYTFVYAVSEVLIGCNVQERRIIRNRIRSVIGKLTGRKLRKGAR